MRPLIVCLYQGFSIIMLNQPRFYLALLILALSQLVGCAGTIDPARYDKQASYHLGYVEGSTLDRYLDIPLAQRQSQTGFVPLNLGHDALLARIALIEAAQHSIDLQYYIYRDDEASQLLTWRLYEAAERGVRVRVLLDDMQSRNDDDLALFSRHPNIEVRLFNPHQYRNARSLALISDFDRLNRRMHNKSLSVDGAASIIGGRNIGNEYFSVSANVEFGDLDLLLVGNTVDQIGDQFDLYWNDDYTIPIEWLNDQQQTITNEQVTEWNEEAKLEQKFSGGKYDFAKLPIYHQFVEGSLNFYWGDGKVLYDLPTKISDQQSDLTDSIVELLKQAEHSLLIISPYFVPTESGTQQMVDAIKANKRIIVVTNSLASNDVFAVHGWYAKYRQTLVEGGVELWEIKADAKITKKWSITGSSRSSLHAKAFVIDEKDLFVGSMNWDPRSAVLNTEMGVVIHHPEYSSKIWQEMPELLRRAAYEIKVEDGDIVWLDHQSGQVFTSEPGAGIFRRIGAWFSGVLPIEDHL